MLETILTIVGALIIVASCCIAGNRLHHWLFGAVPQIGERLPADTGAWLGLLVGVALLIY